MPKQRPHSRNGRLVFHWYAGITRRLDRCYALTFLNVRHPLITTPMTSLNQKAYPSNKMPQPRSRVHCAVNNVARLELAVNNRATSSVQSLPTFSVGLIAIQRHPSPPTAPDACGPKPLSVCQLPLTQYLTRSSPNPLLFWPQKASAVDIGASRTSYPVLPVPNIDLVHLTAAGALQQTFGPHHPLSPRRRSRLLPFSGIHTCSINLLRPDHRRIVPGGDWDQDKIRCHSQDECNAIIPWSYRLLYLFAPPRLI